MASLTDTALLSTLRERFEAHRHRHADLAWEPIRARLEAAPAARKALQAMELSGGEPDVIGVDAATHQVLFCDCSVQSPSGRRSLCYDEPAWRSRKQNKPAGSAVQRAQAMGVELLDEARYRALQALGNFDTTTSSWVLTPPPIRARGGALFCDHRYGQVFTYHNGAESYYAARGFRALLRV